jgi:hypothetical protein
MERSVIQNLIGGWVGKYLSTLLLGIVVSFGAVHAEKPMGSVRWFAKCVDLARNLGVTVGDFYAPEGMEFTEFVDQRAALMNQEFGGNWDFTGPIEYPQVLSGRSIAFLTYDEAARRVSSHVVPVTTATVDPENRYSKAGVHVLGKLKFKLESKRTRNGTVVPVGTKYTANRQALESAVQEGARLMRRFSEEGWRDPREGESVSGKSLYGVSVDTEVGTVTLFQENAIRTEPGRVLVNLAGQPTWVKTTDSSGRNLIRVLN